jgi:hypothetical protein
MSSIWTAIFAAYIEAEQATQCDTNQSPEGKADFVSDSSSVGAAFIDSM